MCQRNGEACETCTCKAPVEVGPDKHYLTGTVEIQGATIPIGPIAHPGDLWARDWTLTIDHNAEGNSLYTSLSVGDSEPETPICDHRTCEP